ncbi:MAG: hypothetical protein ACR2QV_06165 [Gammaproteobacteria bacterium]
MADMRSVRNKQFRCDRRQVLTLLLALLPAGASANHRFTREQCRRISERMKKLQSRLRQGYSAKQGRRYREKMRELQLQRFRKC